MKSKQDEIKIVGELTLFYTDTPDPNGKRYNVQKVKNSVTQEFYKRLFRSIANTTNYIYMRTADDGMFGVSGIDDGIDGNMYYHDLVASGEQMAIASGGDGDEEYVEFYGTKLCASETTFGGFFLGLKDSLSEGNGFLTGSAITNAQWNTFLENNLDYIFMGVFKSHTVPAGRYAHVYYKLSGSGVDPTSVFDPS